MSDVRLLGHCLELKGSVRQETGEGIIMWSYIICMLHGIIFR